MPTFFPRPEKGIPIVTEAREMTEDFQIYFQKLLEMIEGLPSVQQDIVTLQGLITTAETAITNLETASTNVTAQANLNSSGVTPNPLSATDAGASATITVAAHTRTYGDGTTLAIVGPSSLLGLAYSTIYYVYYDDPTRADTTPTYATTTSIATAAQVGNRHLVGSVTTPAAAAPATVGEYVAPPGIGQIIS